MPDINDTINYIEFPMLDVVKTKKFYSEAFGWKFTDWGESYISFDGAGVAGGFNGLGEVKPEKPGVLVVLYANNLEKKCEVVMAAGGKIKQAIYSFPGGRRFHFADPNGNELAVWSDK